MAAFALLVFMAPSMVMWGQTRDEEVYSTCLFGSTYNQQSVGSYTATWTTVNGDFTWTIVNGNNNNNGWSYVKFGRKNNASVGQITTSAAYSEAITKVELTIDAITTAKINSIKLYTSTDNSTWTEAGSFSKAVGVQTVSLSNPTENLYYKIEFDCASGSSNGLVTVSKVEYYYNTGGTIAPSITAADVEIAYNATSGEIEYTINNPVSGGVLTASTTATWLTPGTVGNESVAFTCEENEDVERTATVVLTYSYNTDQTVTKNVIVTQAANPNGPGTQNNPYTVAQARAAIDAGTGLTNVYATGIISQVDSYNSSYNSITYWISDDGTTTDQLQVYSGKGLNNTNFTSIDDVEVGAIVVVYGTLKKYNTTYEFDKNNYLTSYTAPQHDVETPTFSPAAGTYTEAQTVTLSCETSGATIYYTLDGTEPTNASTEYTTALTISTTTTIKAIAYDGTNYSNVATATYHFCSADDPYTVTEALDFTEYPANGIYVEGVVSTAPTSLSSGTLTYYISVDGDASNQLEVYKGKGMNNEAFTAVDDIQVGDIVTVYGNVVIYNNIKEFAQGNYLVAFERPTTPAQEYTLTIANPANVTFTVAYGEEVLTNGENADIENGTEITLTLNVATGYVLEALTVTGEDSQTVTVTETSTAGVYTFNMPAFNATVNASVSVATTGTYTLATSIESGKQYIIVGQADGNYYAMGNDKGNNRYAYGITLNGTTATANIANNGVHEFTITSLETEGYYSIMDETTSGGYLYAASSSSNYLKTEATLDENHNGDWKITIADGSFSVVADKSSNRNVMQFNNSSTLFACYASASQHPVYLYVKDETPAGIDLFVSGYNTSTISNGGYHLIASPIVESVSPTAVTNMIDATAANYDLFRFNQDETIEWQNYKGHTEGFVIESGKGYLYAHNTDVTLTFNGTAYSGDGTFALTQSSSNTSNGGKMNVLGNPFNTETTIGNISYYKMNESGTNLEATVGGTIGALEGIMVEYDSENPSVTFSTSKSRDVIELLALNLKEQDNDIDRVLVRFDGGNRLHKYQIFSSSNIYIPKNGQNYAVVNGQSQGTLPINFKATANGTYTLNIDTENVAFRNLHLIDKLTDTDIDLLSRASYSFDATTDDAEDRFVLVYSKDGEEEAQTYLLTITPDDFTTGGYAANNTEKTSYAVNVNDATDTYEVKWVSENVMKNGDNMQWKKGAGRIYNVTNLGSVTDVTVTYTSGGFTTYYGNQPQPAFSGVAGQPFFQTKAYNEAVGTSSKMEVTFDIVPGSVPDTYSVTFDAGEGTFVGNEDFPVTENNLAAGTYTLPSATREGYIFNGWLLTGSTTPRTGEYTVYTDAAFTAQYTENSASGGNGGTDVLDRAFTGVTSTSYTDWSEMEGESGAVYAGNSAGGNDAIQLKSNGNTSGIITTASGGLVSKVEVSWNSNTSNGRTLNVYGKNTAYTAVSDLYNTSNQGTLLGTIVCGTSTVLNVTGEYTYIGMRSNSGAMWLDEISITWVLPSDIATPTFSPDGGTYLEAQTVTIECSTEDAVIYYTTDGTTPDNNSTLYTGAINVTESMTIQAIAYVGTEASNVGTATYTILVPQTIAEVRAQGTGSVFTYGVVTAISTSGSNTTAYIQDMTAAIVVYGEFSAEMGDEIQVQGTLTTYKGLLEIASPTVAVASQGNVIEPVDMTIDDINVDAESENSYQAMLVHIVDATVTAMNGNNTTIAQGDNTITVYGSLGEVAVNDVISFDGNIGCYTNVQIVNPTNIEIQNATTYTFVTDGDWFDASNWEGGEVPADGSDVTIAANATVYDGYVAVVNEMTITTDGSLTIEEGGQVKSNTSFEGTIKKEILGYDGTEGNARYYLIAAPAIVDMCTVDGFMPSDNTLHNEVDFYSFDQSFDGEEWRNYKHGYEYFAGPYNSAVGQGYLYANKNNTTLNFASVGYNIISGSNVQYFESPFAPTNVDVTVETPCIDGVAWAGYNLLGNPYTCDAYLVNGKQFFRMNDSGDAVIPAELGAPIKPCEGIFVVCTANEPSVTFTADEPALGKAGLAINLSQGRSVKDRAIIRFGEESNISKFVFNERASKLYIPQDGKDCSVVSSDSQGEMPVSFKAAKNGTYTLTVSESLNSKFLTLNYLHLIDNLTGADVDLLANPSYSFEANTNDYASRFRLVFATGNDDSSSDFAFVSNDEIIVNGEGMLQVIDMTGRIISTSQVNGMSSIKLNAAAGVYVLRLNDKTQKIVIR